MEPLGGLLGHLRGVLGRLRPSWSRLRGVLRRLEASSRPPGGGRRARSSEVERDPYGAGGFGGVLIRSDPAKIRSKPRS